MTSATLPHDSRAGASGAYVAVACLALLAYAYHATGGALWDAWHSPEYSHGLLIPFIALLIGWHRLAEARPLICPSWWGLLPLALGGLLLLLSVLAAFPAAAQYGFVLSLSGLSLAFAGVAATRLLLPAFLYVLFAIPLPHLVYANLSQLLQLWSSTLGVRLLDMLGIPVFQEGNIIDLGRYKLQVAEACNGLRYLFPLASFSFLAAYMLKDRMWKRAVLFLSAIPITIGMNALRIAAIGMAVNLWGPGMAEGMTHQFEGWAVFLLCILLLAAEIRFLLRIEPRGHFRFDLFGLPQGALFSGAWRLGWPLVAAGTLVALMAVIFGTGMIDERPEIIPPHPPLASFPARLGPWHGRAASIAPDVLHNLELSDYWLADYSDSSPQAVNLYIAWYDRQHTGSATHSPANCIPGGGWQIVSHSIAPVHLANGASLSVSRLLISKGSLKQLVYYWFDERGRIISDTDIAKWYLFRDAIVMHRTDGALIRLVTPVESGESAGDADRRLTGFLSLAYPALKRFIPGARL